MTASRTGRSSRLALVAAPVVSMLVSVSLVSVSLVSVSLVSVSLVAGCSSDDGGAAEAFVDEIGVTFPQYLDRDGALLDELRIAGLPATIAIDSAGNVVSVHSGTIDAAGIRELAADVSDE